MDTTVKVICDQCKQEISSVQTTKRLVRRGFFDVGFQCPHCQFWVHSHYTTQKLDLAERILSNFKDASTKSHIHRVKYERKIAEFMGQHQKVQEDAARVLGVKNGAA